MNKGCFISVIVILTIIVGGVFYLINNYEDEIKEFGKQKIIELAELRFQEDLDKLPKQQYTDSLKFAFGRYFEKLKRESMDSIMLQQENIIKELANNFDVIIRDKQIDSAEYIFITKQLEKNE